MSTTEDDGLYLRPHISSDTDHLRLTALPPELKCAVFAELPDVTSAKSLALVSLSFFLTFLDAQSLILTRVLQNEITPDLLQGAYAAYKASKIPIWTKRAVQDFLGQYFRKLVLYTDQRWSLAEALRMSKVHSCVEFFATEFASSALSKNPTPRGSNAAPSVTEMIRIKRIFYRFELYCNLFRKPSYDRMVRGERNCLIQPIPFETQEQQRIFFDEFSPWENEQLSCILDYLVEVITAPFNDVAKHDVDWGELSVPWVSMFGHGELFYKEGYLSKGLEFIFQLSNAWTYDDRHRILLSNQGSGGHFLFSALSPARFYYTQGIFLEEYNDEEDALFVKRPFDVDSDSGPTEVWRWAHALKTRDRFYFLKEHRPLRKSGYVMWDLERLRDWNLLERPVKDMIARRSPGHPTKLEWQVKQQEQLESWEERSRIWVEGGRGWWTPGDESHIEWPRR